MNNNTSFIKDLFHFDGMYLNYGSGQYTKDARFVVDEYFSALKIDAPARILRSKGWVSPTVTKSLSLSGS